VPKKAKPGLYKAINAKQERIKAGDFKAAAKTAKKPKPKKK
jgi:hypothetical protein